MLENADIIIKKVERLKQNVEQKSGRTTRIKEETDYYPIVSDIEWEKVIQIEVKQDNFPGIRIIPRPERIYPEQKLASHVLGYMTKLNEDEWKANSDKWNNYILSSSDAGNETSSLLYDGYAENDYIGRTGVEAEYEEKLRGLRGKNLKKSPVKIRRLKK